MKVLVSSMILLLVISYSGIGMELDDFSISATIYPQRLPDSFEDGWLVNAQEWLSISVDFTIDLWQGLYFRSDTQTFMFGTNGLSFAPSSTKFISEFGYDFGNFHIKVEHYCHHYFKQYPNNPYSDKDKITFMYHF